MAEAQIDSDNWADELWDRPDPDPERVARWRLHDVDEASWYVRHTAHLPLMGDEAEETGAFWMRLLRRASSAH